MVSADGNNGGKWDKNFVAALFAIVIGAIVTIATPELRKCFHLEDSKPAPEPVAPSVEEKKPIQQQAAPEKLKPKPVTPTQRPAESSKPPSLYTLHEDEPQFVAIASATLSFSWTIINKESIVSLHISPDGGKQSNHPVWTGDSVEFSSAAGDFFVSILSVNVDEKKISVQVSKTGSKN